MGRFLLTSVVLLASVACQSGSQPSGPAGAAVQVTHGPILGRPGAHQIGIWARTSHAGEFQVRYGTAPDRLDMLSERAQTNPEHDNTNWILIQSLESSTKYYYELLLPGEGAGATGLGGSFHTFPAPEDTRNPEHNPKGLFNFRFEFGGGNAQGGVAPPGSRQGNLPTFETMLSQLHREQDRSRIDFAILNGDWLYEEKRDYPPDQWLEQVSLAAEQKPDIVDIAPTIVGVWENYKLYLSRGKMLAAWHRVIPSFFTFDDHEVVNDLYGTGEVGRYDRRTVFRDIGLRAWYDYLGWSNPIQHTQSAVFGRAEFKAGSDVLTDRNANFADLKMDQVGTLHVHWGTSDAGAAWGRPVPSDTEGGDPNAGVFEIVEVLDANHLRIRPSAKADGMASYSIGQMSHFRRRISNADLFFLDTRSHRTMHDVTQPGKRGVSMLGTRQKTWLRQEMAASDADVFFVISSVNFMIPHTGSGAGVNIPNKDEAWTVFLDEREELIRFWDSIGKPVFVLTGDIHNSFAIKITDRIWEFSSGPHNSSNHPIGAEGGRPANGVFYSQGRKSEIRWSSYLLDDTPRELLRRPVYCVVQVNNVFNNPNEPGEQRWIAYPHPQVTFQYYDGLTGDLLYAESILAGL